MKTVQMVAVNEPLCEMAVPLPEPKPDEALIRIRAAGICHSDVHYWCGFPPLPALPVTLGHEVAGVVEKVGTEVRSCHAGDWVGIHYLAVCGVCDWCRSGSEQFCTRAQMIGKQRPGGFAEYIAMPEKSLVPLPENIPFEHAAIMMCSTATAFHALRKGRLQSGETVAIFGSGGLGISAIQLASLLGADQVFAVDIRADKLDRAKEYGAVPVLAQGDDPLEQIRLLTAGRGVDVALELVGSPLTAKQAVGSLANLGRAVLVGLCRQGLQLDVYREMLGREAEVIGCSDHLRSELPVILDWAAKGRLDFSRVVTQRIPLQAAAINEVLLALKNHSGAIRTVIVP